MSPSAADLNQFCPFYGLRHAFPCRFVDSMSYRQGLVGHSVCPLPLFAFSHIRYPFHTGVRLCYYQSPRARTKRCLTYRRSFVTDTQGCLSDLLVLLILLFSRGTGGSVLERVSIMTLLSSDDDCQERGFVLRCLLHLSCHCIFIIFSSPCITSFTDGNCLYDYSGGIFHEAKFTGDGVRCKQGEHATSVYDTAFEKKFEGGVPFTRTSS